MNFRNTIRAITSHPYTTLLIALILIGTSAAEAWETIGEDLAAANLGAHHGVMLFGIVSLIGVVPDLLEGFERLVAHEPNEV